MRLHPALPSLLLALLASPAPAAEPQVAAAATAPRPTVDFGVGVRAFSRTFGLDSGATSVPRYQGTGLGVAVDGRLFPFASVSPGFWGNLGLEGEAQLSLGLSATRAGHVFPASATTLRGGLALRLPFGASELSLHAGAGSQAFQLATISTDGQGTLAQVDPGFLGPRFGLGYRVQLGQRVGLTARAAFLYTVSRGQLDALYTRASALGVDAALAVSVTLVPGVQLRALGDWSRVFVSLSSTLPASEQQFGGSILVVMSL